MTIRELLLRPAAVIVAGGIVGLVGWGGGGLVLGVLAGIVLSFVIGEVVNRLQGGPIPKEHRHTLIENVLAQHPNTVRAAYPDLDEDEQFEAIEEHLQEIVERAVSNAPTPGSVWNAQNVLQAATTVSLKQDTEEQRELFGIIGQQIANDWYLRKDPEAGDPDLQANKTEIGDFIYHRMNSTTGQGPSAHTLTTRTPNLDRHEGVLVKKGAELEFACGPKVSPHGEIHLITGSELPEEDSLLVQWQFDDTQPHQAPWKVVTSTGAKLRATGYLSLNDRELIRSIMGDAVGAELLTVSFDRTDGSSATYRLGLDGLAEGLNFLPCF